MKNGNVNSNKRNKVRIPLNKTGCLDFRNFNENCVVIDISSNGIGLAVRSYFQEADEFRISFPLEDGVEIRGSVFVVFANGSRVGGRLKFFNTMEQQKVENFINKNTSRLAKEIK